MASPSPDRGLKLAKRYKAKHFTDGFDLIQHSDIDVIDICVPTGLHKDFILASMDKGLHVYSEKPIAASIKEIEEIVDANKRTERIIFNGFNYRFFPEFRRIRSIINSGELGDIRYIKMMRVTKENPASYMFGNNSCGLFNEFHCHFVDLMFSFGFGNPEKVFASGTTVHNWKINPDTATMVLFYPDNMITEITTSLSSPGMAPEVLIIGTEGTLRLSYGSVSTVKKRDVWTLPSSVNLMFKESIVNPFRILRNPFKWSCEHFIDCVIKGTKSDCDEASALRTFKVTDRAVKSYFENRPVAIS